MQIKTNIKRILKELEAYLASKYAALKSEKRLVESLESINASEPPVAIYFSDAIKTISVAEQNFSVQINSLLVEPLRTIYFSHLKQIEMRKKDFESSSSEYLCVSCKVPVNEEQCRKIQKKLVSDSKFLNRKRDFEVVRFQYYIYLKDICEGLKAREILYHLTCAAEKHFECHEAIAYGLGELKVNLFGLVSSVADLMRDSLVKKRSETKNYWP